MKPATSVLSGRGEAGGPWVSVVRPGLPPPQEDVFWELLHLHTFRVLHCGLKVQEKQLVSGRQADLWVLCLPGGHCGSSLRPWAEKPRRYCLHCDEHPDNSQAPGDWQETPGCVDVEAHPSRWPGCPQHPPHTWEAELGQQGSGETDGF